jgi:hypothetical protein
MCKSSAEGGQRCFTDAKTILENKTAASAKVQAKFDEGKATVEQVMAAAAAVQDAMIDYASTQDGADDLISQYNQMLTSGALDSGDESIEDQAEVLLSTVDEGAKRAAANRAVENAYRATQGKPPLTTSLPKTFDELIAEAEERNRAEAEKAAKEADPFGLRAEAAKERVHTPSSENIRTVASSLHVAWQREFFAENGEGATHLVNDGAGGTFDIAHTDYDDLPERWQNENRPAAESALARVAAASGSPSRKNVLEEAAAGIHEDWVSRMGVWAPPSRARPWEQLSEDNKEKHRVGARAAAKAMGVQL